MPDNRRDGEDRRLTVGCLAGETYVVVYAMRGEARRIITAWKVGDDGKQRYQASYDRGNPGDERTR